jgi:inosine/xanthosine triphosphate pyrophosphatase family protein
MNRELIIATGNNGKLKEITHILSGLPFAIKSL